MYAGVHRRTDFRFESVAPKSVSRFIIPCSRKWLLKQAQALPLQHIPKSGVDLPNLVRLKVQYSYPSKVSDSNQQVLWRNVKLGTVRLRLKTIPAEFVPQMIRFLDAPP
jgi:hypothetical protein